MPTSPPATGTITTADISTLATLARIQGDIGADTLTKAGLTDFMAQLNTLSFTDYGATTDERIRGWADLLYTALMATQTSYGQPVPALWVAYNLGLYTAGNYEAWYESSGDPFANFMGLNVSSGIPMWNPPTQSPAWSQFVKKMINYWWVDGNDLEVHVPRNIIGSGMGYQQEIAFQANLLDPQNWTDAVQVTVGARPLWAAQRTCLNGLVAQTELRESDCLLLPFLLIAMLSSASADDRTLGLTIANLPTTSIEKPNDIFADQLIYYLLMALADPAGNYAQTNAQLSALIGGLVLAVPNQDPGSQVLNKTLTEQARILIADDAYPLQDPYDPSVGFTQRQTDTLAALNQAWTSLPRT
jgi:hypothetical protein